MSLSMQAPLGGYEYMDTVVVESNTYYIFMNEFSGVVVKRVSETNSVRFAGINIKEGVFTYAQLLANPENLNYKTLAELGL
jgi:hypothetical protein